ncbi:MAG TPA: GyrI-like domain-containing protein [Gemmatales bacterium]|nr:GyrI-like domain-containing protein [Gemmatales bacterium]
MKVMVMVKATKESEAGVMPSQQLLTDMGKFNEELVKAGIMQDGAGLHPSSKGVRIAFSGTNRTQINGPFAETRELIAGYWVWKVKSMQEAIDWAKRCPNPMSDDSILEIRPYFEADDFGAEFTPELREQEASLRAQSLRLGEPRFENSKERLIAGLQSNYTMETRKNIPGQWTRFAPMIGKIAGQVGKSSYGVCYNCKPDGSFDYLTGVEVNDTKGLPAGFAQVKLPGQRYAVFTHSQPVTQIPNTIETIWNKWVPDCGLKVDNSPCFERYTEAFNPQTGIGGTEIWVPLKQ